MTAIGKAGKESLAAALAAKVVLGSAGTASLAPAILFKGGRELFGGLASKPVSRDPQNKPVATG